MTARRCFACVSTVLCLATTALATPASDGVLHVKSWHSVADTSERAKRMIEHFGFRLLGEIDYADAGNGAAPIRLIVFSDTRMAAPVVRKNRLAALDMPLKLLIWEDATQGVWLSYNSAEYLASRHRLSLQDASIQKVAKALRALAIAAAGK